MQYDEDGMLDDSKLMLYAVLTALVVLSVLSLSLYAAYLLGRIDVIDNHKALLCNHCDYTEYKSKDGKVIIEWRGCPSLEESK